MPKNDGGPARSSLRRPNGTRAERWLDEQNTLLRLVALGRPLTEVLNGIVAFLERESNSILGSVMLVDEKRETLRLGAGPSLPAFFAAALDGFPIGPASGACGTTAFTKSTVIIADVSRDPRTLPWLDLVKRAGIAACASTPILDANGHVSGTFALYFPTPREPTADELELVELARDLASVAIERDREHGALMRLQADLERRVVERTDELESFAYSVSHDLRAPLRAIDGRLAMLVEDMQGTLTPELSFHLESARRAARNMSELIDDMLDLSRCGRQVVKRIAIEPASLVREAWEETADARRGHRVELEIETLPTCVADRALLAHVWTNLLSNAVKYSRVRDVARVIVGGERRRDEVVYWVRDNGIGFDPAYADQIFGVFQRLHAQDAYEGTGVGLALVKRIVERHDGRVWAESKVGEGALFAFALPLDAP